ncbi:hypothetical protein [Flavobacterium eburneipallidum]|uniref:hypothetical protein n=1 Tax=Flavobacterium eburneipallidum TaxID=3003263 RepID=UPI002482B84D|nr:hypothetical protein [Flavobacterium eburneipallidum]
MDLNITAIVSVIPLFINFILLYNRKKKWVKNKYKWFAVMIFFLVGICLYTNSNEFDEKSCGWAFVTPFLFSVFDFIIMKLSYAIHNRDLYLWLRGSSDIDDKKFSGGKKVKTSDRIFSFFLLFLIIILPYVFFFF